MFYDDFLAFFNERRSSLLEDFKNLYVDLQN